MDRQVGVKHYSLQGSESHVNTLHDRWSCTERIFYGWDHYIADTSDYTRSFPCMEATYPYAIKNQRKTRNAPSRGFGCLELVPYDIRLGGLHTGERSIKGAGVSNVMIPPILDSSCDYLPITVSSY